MDMMLFIGLLIAGVTQTIKTLIPRVHGWVTVAVAVLTGIVIALIDEEIELLDISVTQGILIALATVGVFSLADRLSRR